MICVTVSEFILFLSTHLTMQSGNGAIAEIVFHCLMRNFYPHLFPMLLPVGIVEIITFFIILPQLAFFRIII